MGEARSGKVKRFAGEALRPGGLELLRTGMADRNLAAPAFEYGADGFEATPQARQVLDLFNRKREVPLQMKPAVSVDAMNGQPIWGSGGGYVLNGDRNTAVVDPLAGQTTTVAHEAAHATFPTPGFTASLGRHMEVDPLALDRDSGARLRYVHDQEAGPITGEEAHAEGMAQAVVEGLGHKSDNLGWADPKDYPLSYSTKGLSMYAGVEQGPWSAGEGREEERILRNSGPYVNRLFDMGYRRGMGLFGQ